MEKTKRVFNVTLFPSFAGERLMTRKNFPGGSIELSIPSIKVVFEQAVIDFCKKYYNDDPQSVFESGEIQEHYNDSTWDTVKKSLYPEDKDAKAALTKEQKIALEIRGIEKQFGSMDAPDFTEKVRVYLEAGILEDKKTKTKATTKKVSVAEAQAIATAKAAGLDLATTTAEDVKAFAAWKAQRDKQTKRND